MGILTSLRDSQTQSHVDRTGQALRLQTEASPHQAGLLLSPGLGQDPGWIGKIKEKQKFFNLDNGLRVHERGGMKDSALYNFTVLLIFLGAVEYCRVLYRLVFPKSD